VLNHLGFDWGLLFGGGCDEEDVVLDGAGGVQVEEAAVSPRSLSRHITFLLFLQFDLVDLKKRSL